MKKIKELVIKGIIKTINKLGCQYEVLNNINENCYVKEYEKNEYIAEYSYCDIFSSDKLYFMDLEFLKNKRIGSIGCILVKNRKIIDEFHLINNNKKFSTKGLEKSIKEGVETVNNKKELFLRFKQFLNRNGNYPIIVWGSDGLILNKYSINHNIQFKYVHDICHMVSNLISYKGVKLGEHMIISLDDMKILYDINGKVKHNALSDSIDLSKVFFSYIDRKEPNMHNKILYKYFYNLSNNHGVKIEIDNKDIDVNGNYEMEKSNNNFIKYLNRVYGIINECQDINKTKIPVTKKYILINSKHVVNKCDINKLNLKIEEKYTEVIINNKHSIKYSNDIKGIRNLIKWLNEVNN